MWVTRHECQNRANDEVKKAPRAPKSLQVKVLLLMISLVALPPHPPPPSGRSGLLFCQGWFQLPSAIFNLASPQLSSHLI